MEANLSVQDLDLKSKAYTLNVAFEN